MTKTLVDLINAEKFSTDTAIVIGLAPTATHFKLKKFIQDVCPGAITIGLNEAFLYHDVDISVTIHPEIFYRYVESSQRFSKTIVLGKQKFENFLNDPRLQKASSLDAFIKAKDELSKRDLYLFDYRLTSSNSPLYDPSDAGRHKFLIEMDQQKNDYLYAWSSICQTAMHLASKLGAKQIILIGCDSRTYGGKYRLNSHTLWKGAPPWYRLRQYAEGNMEVAGALSTKGVQTTTLLPYSSVNDLELEYQNFKEKCSPPEIFAALPYDFGSKRAVTDALAALSFWIDFVTRSRVSLVIYSSLKIIISGFIHLIFWAVSKYFDFKSACFSEAHHTEYYKLVYKITDERRESHKNKTAKVPMPDLFEVREHGRCTEVYTKKVNSMRKSLGVLRFLLRGRQRCKRIHFFRFQNGFIFIFLGC